MRAAFPDIDYRMRLLEVDGDTVRVSSQLSGTHSGALDLTPLGMGVIEATGKSFSLPEETSTASLEGGQLRELKATPTEGGGLMGILAQLGVAPPAG